MKKLSLAIAVGLMLTLGTACGHIVGIGKDVCETVAGGSRLGELCAELDKLNTDSAE